LNRRLDEASVYLEALRATDKGRLALVGLLDNDEPGIRLAAATEALSWDESKARTVLEELDAKAGFPFNASAAIVLEEFDAGRLGR
jgi:hypothetical protein